MSNIMRCVAGTGPPQRAVSEGSPLRPSLCPGFIFSALKSRPELLGWRNRLKPRSYTASSLNLSRCVRASNECLGGLIESALFTLLPYVVEEASADKPPRLNEVLRLIAQLGGFLARKSDGEPGVKTIWHHRITVCARGIAALKYMAASDRGDLVRARAALNP